MSEDALTTKMLDAVRALLEDVLDSQSPTRFAEAARICQLAHSLAQTRGARVGHFAGELEVVGENVVQGGAVWPLQNVMPGPRPLPPAVRWAPPVDDQANRNAAMAGDQVTQSQIDANRAAARAVESRELIDLFDLRKRLGEAAAQGAWTAIVDGRIDAIMKGLEARNAEGMVPADDARRREAGIGGRGEPGHAGDGQGAVDDRAQRGRAAGAA